MMNIRASRVAVTAIALLTPAAVLAGGYTAPVVPATPIVAPEVQTAAPWGGAYAGGSLGYSFGGDDEIGLELFDGGTSTDRETDLNNLKLAGPTAGLHVGYRWQRDRLVFGPELGVEIGGVDDQRTVNAQGAVVDMKSEVNNIISLRMKTGYLVNDTTMVFGTAGAVRGDFDYSIIGTAGSISESYTANGYSLGLGVERKMSDRMSLTAEWEYRNFGKTDVDFAVDADSFLRTEATPEHHNLKLGVNFSF